jgi:hypothetical protein
MEMLGEHAHNTAADSAAHAQGNECQDMKTQEETNAASKCPSPFIRRTDVCCSPLTPLNQAKSRGFAETDSPMGQTPIMFAQFFLDAEENDVEGNTKVKPGIPVPPLYQSETGPRPSRSGRKFEFNDVQFDPAASRSDHDPVLMTPFSSEPLCLPPRRKTKKTTPKPKKKSSSPTKSPKKQKKEEKPESLVRGHIITPSSAAIVALSTEIRNQMKSSPGSNDDLANSSPRSTGKATLDDSNRSDDSFSIPQFATSMEASQFSQQSIHDWDKKFGLRRTHSKTMRESARSRKNVLEFLKGDGSELLKSALAAGLKQSTSTSTTFTHSLSGSSFLTQDEEENLPHVQIKVEETVHEGSEEEKSHEEEMQDQAIHGTFQIRTKDEYQHNERLYSKTSTSTSTPGLNTDEDDDQSMGFGSIGSFSHEHEANQLDVEDHENHDSQDFASSYSSKILEFDFDDEELTNMFRRASLDHMPENLRSSNFRRRSSSVIIPTFEEPERKQCFAKSA